MPKARIYRPEKTATQSGKAKDAWVLEFIPEAPYFTDGLMGWTGMTDMKQEIRLTFPTKEAALAYAKRRNLPCELLEPKPRRMLKKAYADNFSASKRS